MHVNEAFAIYQSDPTPENRQAIHTNAMKLIWRTAHRFANTTPRVESEELLTSGFFGVDRAINSFKPDRGATFITWMCICIESAMSKEMWLLVRHRDHHKGSVVQQAEQALIVRGESPTIENIAAETGLSEQVVWNVHQRGRTVRLDAFSAAAADDESLHHLIPSDDADVVLNRVDAHEAAELILSRTPPRLRAIVELYFVEGLSTTEIGERYGVTRQRIHQQLTAVLRRTRHLAS